MTLPDFLIIGAMKAGTTTLYRDLHNHDQIFLPEVKEPNDLASDHVLTPQGLSRYTKLFLNRKPGQRIGEASTAYTKRPRYEGMAERALELLGPSLKIIFITRDPVSRAVSHYRHELGQGKVSADIDFELINQSRFVDYSKYAYQLSPWLEAFSRNNFLHIEFEEFVKDRKGVCNRVFEFLDVEINTKGLDMGGKFNASDGKLIVRHPMLQKIRDSDWYQRGVKHLLPWRLRERIRSTFLSAARLSKVEPRIETLKEIEKRLSADRHEWKQIGFTSRNSNSEVSL